MPAQLLSKFLAFYASRMFITAFKTARVAGPYQESYEPNPYPYAKLTYILILSSHVHADPTLQPL